MISGCMPDLKLKEILWRWVKACEDIVLVGIFSPFVALKRKKMTNFNISLFFVTSFDFRPFQTDNNKLENTHIINIMVESDSER